MYETRAGRAKTDAQIAEIKKQANDALYETRTGRSKIEEKMAQIQLQISKFSQGVSANFQTQVTTKIATIQADLQQNKAQIANLEKTKPSFDQKVLQGVQDTVSKVKTDLGAAVSRLVELEKLPKQFEGIAVKIVNGKVEKISTDIKDIGIKVNTKIGKDELVREIDFNKGPIIRIIEPRIEEKVNDKVGVVAGGLSALANNLVPRVTDLEQNQNIRVGDPSVPILRAQIDKLKVDLQKNQKDIDDLTTKTKEVEKVNQTAIPKLDQILGILPLIPARSADAIRPSIPTIPQIETASATGTCRTLQPGGCSRKAFDDLGNGINQNTNNQSNNLLDKLNAGANAAQLALLKVIDNKLGAQLPGGLSATFGRLWQMLQVDRIISILTYIAVVHNALMLSNNIFQTLFSAFDNIAQFAGFKWKNEKGDEVGFGALVNDWIGNGLKAVFGEETIKNASKLWNAANRIYQGAANIISAVQSIQQSILTALEVVGAGVARLANALRAAGQVFEKAYEWMNPNPNFDNALFRTLGKLQDTASNIETVSQTPLDIKSSVESMKEEKKQMAEALKDGENALKGLGIIESEKQAELAKKRKEESEGKDLEKIDKAEADD